MNDTEEQLKMNFFQSEDFDAYLPEKWNSNMFTLERRRVKEKLESLGIVLSEKTIAAGLSLVRHSSDEFPSFWNKKQVDRQWLFFSRDEAARAELTDIIDKERTLADTLADPTPMYRQIFLGMSMGEQFLEIGIWMHHDAWVDRRNFVNLCENEEALKMLADMLQGLPEHFEMGLDSGEIESPKHYNPDSIKKMAAVFDNEKSWFFLGARLPRDQVLVLGADLESLAADIFRILIPVYNCIAWSPSNDLISIESILAERNESLKTSREELDRERAEREAKIKESKAVGVAMKEEIAERIRETSAWRSREMAAKRAHAARMAAQHREDDARANAEAMAAKWGLGTKAVDKSEEDKETPKVPVLQDKEVFQKPVLAQQKESFNSGQTPAREKSPSFTGGREKTEKPQFRTSERYNRDRDKKITPHRYLVEMPHTTSEALGEFKCGDNIEVNRGFLKGRRGTIQEVDEKGWIKVAFGMLSSKVAPEDIRKI